MRLRISFAHQKLSGGEQTKVTPQRKQAESNKLPCKHKTPRDGKNKKSGNPRKPALLTY
jgi:hypothetical protein